MLSFTIEIWIKVAGKIQILEGICMKYVQSCHSISCFSSDDSLALCEPGCFRIAVSRIFVWLKSSNQKRNTLLDPMLHAAGTLELLSWNSSILPLKNWRRIWYHPAGWRFIKGFLGGPNFICASKGRVSQCVISQCFCTACANSVATERWVSSVLGHTVLLRGRVFSEEVWT